MTQITGHNTAYRSQFWATQVPYSKGDPENTLRVETPTERGVSAKLWLKRSFAPERNFVQFLLFDPHMLEHVPEETANLARDPDHLRYLGQRFARNLYLSQDRCRLRTVKVKGEGRVNILIFAFPN